MELKPNKPCPFCGEDFPFTITRVLGEDMFNQMKCGECQTLGPSGDTEAEAIAAWNTRPIEDALNQRIKELQTKLAKVISKNETLSCYMCHGSNYLEWVDWDTFDDEHKQKYLQKARSK
jgi:Lar family restriction alleviation protein